MTPEEREILTRLTRVELRTDLLEQDFKNMAKAMEEGFTLANTKLDEIAQMISAGKGAWKALVVVGGVVTFLGGAVIFLITTAV